MRACEQNNLENQSSLENHHHTFNSFEPIGDRSFEIRKLLFTWNMVMVMVSSSSNMLLLQYFSAKAWANCHWNSGHSYE